MSDKVRIDKFIWAIRFFKTRGQASAACRLGRVKDNGQVVKASKEVQVGDVLELTVADVHKKIRIKALLSNRVGAKLVSEFFEDLTPDQEYERVELLRQMNKENRPRGTGRPTKKDRREIEKLKEPLD